MKPGFIRRQQSAAAGTLGGAATGAALGSIIGAATGNPGTGAWAGAAAGALLGGVGGYLYAEHRNSEMLSNQAAAQNQNYNPSQGNLVKIDRVSVRPFGNSAWRAGKPAGELHHPDPWQYAKLGHLGAGNPLRRPDTGSAVPEYGQQ